MSKTLTQAAAAVLAAVITTATFAGANGLATQQVAKADAVVAAASLPVLAAQTVVIVGRRNG